MHWHDGVVVSQRRLNALRGTLEAQHLGRRHQPFFATTCSSVFMLQEKKGSRPAFVMTCLYWNRALGLSSVTVGLAALRPVPVPGVPSKPKGKKPKKRKEGAWCHTVDPLPDDLVRNCTDLF